MIAGLELIIAIGARVMDSDTKHGIVNGSIGTVITYLIKFQSLILYLYRSTLNLNPNFSDKVLPQAHWEVIIL